MPSRTSLHAIPFAYAISSRSPHRRRERTTWPSAHPKTFCLRLPGAGQFPGKDAGDRRTSVARISMGCQWRLGNHQRYLETLDRRKRHRASVHFYIRSRHGHRARNTAAGKTVRGIVSPDSFPPGIIILFAQKNLSNVLDTRPLKEQYHSEVSLFEAKLPLLSPFAVSLKDKLRIERQQGRTY
jgi:hypothetical protein